MIISTRESKRTREKVLQLGISQISGGSKTTVGGYSDDEADKSKDSQQFDISDSRPLDEVVNWLLELGHIPSFCTACYRAGRTGDRFMSLAKTGQIGRICTPNALMTLKEYLEDYAAAATKEIGEKVIAKEVERISDPILKSNVKKWLKDIEGGKRDIRV